MPIELGKVREYAKATANDAPEYFGEAAVPIPPTFLASVIYCDSPGATSNAEVQTALSDLGIEPDIRRVLSAEHEYVFHGPIPRSGDVLTTSQRFDGVEVKEGRRGRMLFIRTAIEFRHRSSDLVAECLYTSVYMADTELTRA
jgi:N-terminal half of MaoC dehydratase